jgi:hypothetical protein
MKKKIIVMATITVEGHNITHNLLRIILAKIKKYFTYQYRTKESNVELVKFELSDNYVEIE